MANLWHEFLQQQGGVLQDEGITHFGNPMLELKLAAEDSIVCSLHSYTTLRVSGEDATTFLQSMLSNDIRLVSDTHAQYSSLNNAKGRVLATLLIWREQADYLLLLPTSLSANICKKLSMYVLRAKVKISDIGQTHVMLGVAGDDKIAAALTSLGIENPLQPLDYSSTAESQLIRLDETRWLIHTTTAQVQSYWNTLKTVAHPVGETCWNWLAIRAGIAHILPATQEQFVAQMLNLDIIGAINFKKGCYPGQEIVARMQYLGKLKRRLYLAHIDSAEPPAIGTELFSDDLAGQSTGMLVNVSPSPNSGFDVLAVVQISSHDSQVVHLGSVHGAMLQFLALPYVLP